MGGSTPAQSTGGFGQPSGAFGFRNANMAS